MSSPVWTDEEIEILKTGVAMRESYKSIGRKIGRTRNAVCAKADRLGIGVGKPIEPQPLFKVRKMPSLPPSAGTKEIFARHRAEAAVRVLVSLFDLGESDCHFPIGDPKTDRAIYCGEPAVPGLAYCASCVSRVYQPPEVQTHVATPERQKIYA